MATRADAVLDAAIRVFATSGFHDASVEDVAEAAGAPVDEVRRQFPARDALLEAVLTRRDDRDAEVVPLMRHAGGLQILRHLQDLARAEQKDPEATTVFTAALAGAVLPNHVARAWAVERYHWGVALYAAAFRRDIEAGLIRSTVDPELLARHTLAVMDGLKVQWLVDPESVDLAGTLGAIVDGLIDSVQVTEA